MKSNNKGITLIALVITIIVLLILAGISIMMLTGHNGILNRVAESKEKTEKAQIKESVKLDILQWQTANEHENITKDIVNQIITGENSINNNTTYADGSGIQEDENGEYFVSKEGNHKIYISDIWNGTTFDNAGPLASEKLVIDEEKKFSPYIKYIDKNGQTILCRVLYDSNSEYGLQIISNSSLNSISLGGTSISEMHSSYANAINILNEQADLYRNEQLSPVGGARSVGSKPLDPSYRDEWIDTESASDTKSKAHSADWSAMTELSLCSTGVSYWLASTGREFVQNDAGLRLIWQVASCEETGELTWVSVDGNDEAYNSYVMWAHVISDCLRPVFTINNDVKLKSGVGDGLTPDSAFEFELR